MAEDTKDTKDAAAATPATDEKKKKNNPRDYGIYLPLSVDASAITLPEGVALDPTAPLDILVRVRTSHALSPAEALTKSATAEQNALPEGTYKLIADTSQAEKTFSTQVKRTVSVK